MQIKNSIVIIVCIFSLLFCWSIWFWNNYPPIYPVYNDVCKEYKTPYDIGFCEGYNWAGTQIQIDNQVNRALRERNDE